MTPPARRDGTPEGNRSRKTQGKNARKKQGASKPAKQKKQRSTDILISNARPARKQYVSERRAPESDSFPGHSEKSEGIRLQKVLAQAGVASRRHAEILIDAGRVEVNGKKIRQQGVRVDPSTDVIRVDGVRVNVNENFQYFVLNKPRGIHSTMNDELGRPCIGDLVSERVIAGQRLFHVGRLDADTEGLILLTNDGELANRLMHPKYEVSKTYLATVLGEVDKNIVRQLRDGIELDDGIAKADYVQIIDIHQGKSLVRVELHEGRKHIVRRMLKAAGYPVQRLVRTKLHTVQLGEQKPGTIRALNDSELTSLYKVVEM